MPTKTSYSSPIQIPGLVNSLVNVAKTVGPEALAKTALKTGAKGLVKGAIKANPLGAAITGAQALFGGIGEDLTDQDVYEQPEYKTNINPMTGQEIPLTMKKPLKMLTGVKAPVTYKMSAAQYKSGLKMEEISGAAPLQANAFYASLNAAKEAGRDTFEVDGKTFDVK